MSTDLFKSEIVNISKEVIRIIDRINELAQQEEDNIADIKWPAYCEPPKPMEKSSRW